MSVTMTAEITTTDTRVDKTALRVARRRFSSPSRRYRVRVKHFKSRHRYIAFVVDSWTGKTVHAETLYTVDPRKGRRPARSSEAGREAARIEADWNATGDGNAVVIQTWKEASDTFLAFKKSERRRSTACLYGQYVRRFSDYLGEVHPRIQYLEEITVAVARDYIPWRRQTESKLSNITLNKDLRHFRHIWQWLVRGGLATKNPWHEIEWLKGTPQQKIWYTADQRDRLLTAASKLGTKFHTACSVFLDTAIRNGELCHATWQHVDLMALTITVAPEPGGWEPKDHQIRMAFFSPETGTLLGQWAAACRNSLVAREHIEPEKADEILQGSRVFGVGLSASHDPYERTFNALLKKACSAAGAPKVTAHALRRTVARLANEAGAGIRDLKELLGHSNLSTTEIYIGREQEDAARRVQLALARAKSGNKMVTVDGQPKAAGKSP